MSRSQPRVLVVDDESAIRDMIRFALERAEMTVDSAADAQEALLRISENRPDIILMDWMMPGVSGIELTRRLRKDAFTEDIPIPETYNYIRRVTFLSEAYRLLYDEMWRSNS